MPAYYQRGFSHIIVLLILFGGIIGGVYLTQNKTNLFPQAAQDKKACPKIELTGNIEVVSRQGCKKASEMLEGRFLCTNSTTYNSTKDIPGISTKCENINNFKQKAQKYCKDLGKNSCLSNASPSASVNKIVLESCQDITESGSYVLNHDISSSESQCLTVNNVSNVHINCNGFKIISNRPPNVLFSAITVMNVSDFSIDNCQTPATSPRTLLPLEIVSGSNGLIQNNTFKGAPIDIRSSHNLRFFKNTFLTSLILESSTNTTVDQNSFQMPTGTNVIDSLNGSFNQITNNTIEGWGTTRYNNADGDTDDGIVLVDEHDDVIRNNTISNVWDCAIETTGTIKNTLFSDNTTKNSSVCGIGAWYDTSWINNKVENNTFEKTPQLFLFFRNCKFRSQDDFVYFKDNVFTNNKLVNQTPSEKQYPRSLIDFSFNNSEINEISGNFCTGTRTVTPNDIKVSNNTFKNNDFGISEVTPFFAPASGFKDGGGNKCQGAKSDTNPLSCQNQNSI